MTYLFIGQDSLSKDIQLKKIRQHFLSQDTEQFNLDILHAKGLTLKDFQERLLSLPVKSNKRVLVIKDAQDLKDDLREFILKYIKAPYKQIILILYINQAGRQDSFARLLQRHAKAFYFKETRLPDTFALNRSLEFKKPDYALRILNQLLKEGQRPERILGGLRYAWEKEVKNPEELRRRFALLLNCDFDIKTGRLRPDFALERLAVALCGSGKPFRQP